MYPILYENITAGIVPQHNGLGVLSDCISCDVERVRNSIYELTMEYPITGIHAEEIAVRRVIKEKPNPTDDLQLFRIDRVGKVMNGKFTVHAKQIAYDLSGYDIASGTANSISGACALLQNNASGWNITTDKTTAGNFKIYEPSSVRSWFGGKEGSILDIFGGADIKYNNFNVQFLNNAGQDRGVTIRYGKNLLELSQEIEDTLFTHVRCYWKNDTTVVTGDKVSTGLTLDVPKCLIIDCSQDYENAPTVAQLTTKATEYKNSHNLTTPTNNITLDFVQSEELSDTVDLCDTVSIYYEALGITRAGAKCVRTKYDCIREKYIETEFGDIKADLSDTLAIASKTLAKTPTTTFMQEAVRHATELITGNLGGYVILHDSNGDGEPDEILIMDTADITTATKVWRWNKNGLGYSSTGYSGTYGTAITSDGQIVADFITAGTLNANLIKAGILSDVNNRSSLDMSSGVAKMYNFDARYRFRLLGNNDNTKCQLVHNTGSGTNLTFYLDDNTDVGGLSASNSNGLTVVLNDKNGNRKATLGDGLSVVGNISAGGNITATGKVTGDKFGAIYIPNSQNNNIVDLFAGTYGGYMYLRNNAGNERGRFFVGSDGDGLLYLFSSSGSGNILLKGQNGNVTCVSVTQTSSRKVKKNIAPIEDSAKILELEAVRFDYKEEEQGKDKRGFIAEDVKEVLPNLVVDGDTPSLNYIEMVPYLQDVVKKQAKRIDELESRIARLEEMLQSSKGE